MSPGDRPGAGTDSVLARLPNLILPVGLVASLLVILAPLPPALLDVLLAANIGVAVIMLLTAVYVRTPLEFSIFPSLLLATTLGRLVFERQAGLSGAICVLLAWDAPRREFVGRLRALGVPVLVLVVGDAPAPPDEAEGDVHRLQVGRVAEGLAAL